MSPQRLALGAASLLGAFSVVAQTVTYMPPVLESPKTASTPPTVKWHWRPDAPDQLKNSQEIGYVLLHVSETAEGKVIGVLDEVNVLPIRDSMTSGGSDLWTLRPAKIDGKPVETHAFFAAIFNPKPVPGPGYDTPAQLVVVTPAHAKKRDPNERNERILRATLSVSEKGQVTDAVLAPNEDPYFLPSLLRATSRWGFTPASLAGKPVASQVTMAIALTESDPEPAHKPVFVHPIVKSQTAPIYPFSMRYLGIEGQVVVDFVVDADGKVTNAYTIKSSAPWFDGPALDAVRQWTFKPGSLDGVPAGMEMEVPIVFTLNGEGHAAYSVDSKHGQGEYPAAAQNIMPPIFPYDAFLRHQDGSATVRMLVAPDGHVAQVQVTSASAPEFGMALSAAAATYTFVPAFKDGKPVPSYVNFKKEFAEYDMTDWEAHNALSLATKHPERIVPARKLDKPIRPISQRPPVPPPDLASPETVMISILVDEKGKPQLAHVLNGPSDACAYAAIQAVSNWLFDPPLSGGDTVTTQVVVPVRFAIGSPPPAASAN